MYQTQEVLLRGVCDEGLDIVRWMLWREGSIPWRYTRLLEYGAERAFLRRVGGKYEFAHRADADGDTLVMIVGANSRAARCRRAELGHWRAG